ncbi:MAG: phage tail sheath subtilisin-like domain-containing protein [Romboutsia sp.]|nr:phage tail sheath subtilisin-like domain-containing protein [Romboutsia sp.]
MNSAKITETIVDLSGRVGTSDGIFAYIALPGAKKGPLGEPRFVTEAEELLNIYTTEQTVKPSDNLAFFDALTYLARANKLYVMRPDNGAGFGGLSVPKEQPAVTFKPNLAVALNTQLKPTDFPALRLAGTYYNVGDMMRPTANAKFKFECTKAGTSSSTPVDFSGITTAGQTVEDGSVTWTSRDMNHPIDLVFKCITAGTTGATEPIWPTKLITDGSATKISQVEYTYTPEPTVEVPDPEPVTITLSSVRVGAYNDANDTITVVGEYDSNTYTYGTYTRLATADKTVSGTPFYAFANDGTNIYTVSATPAANDYLYTVEGDRVSTVVSGSAEFEAVAVDLPEAAITYELNPEIDHVFADNEVMFIHGKYPGKDNDNIGVKLYTYQNYPDIVNEPGAFLIEVYYRGTGQPVESFICSRDLAKKDGYGQNIYVETAVASSNYIDVIDNPAIDSMVDPVDILETTYMGGGYDGIETITDGMMMSAADKINNRTTFPIKLLLDGNWTTPNYHRKLNAIAADRKDCLALLSTPYSAENSNAYVQEIINYRRETLNLNSYWSAMYTPHLQIYDQYNDRNIWIGASSSAAATISQVATNFAPWYPPAGLNRGILPSVSDVKRRFNEPQMDLLCNNQINPVAFFTGEGIVLWGNQTLYSRPSALQSLNVMLLIITVLPQISKALRNYLFEFNDNDTRSLIKTIVDDYMNTVKTQKGVYDFQVSVHASDDDIDNGILYVDLIIKPTLAINEIKFRIVPIRSGDSFANALEILG